MPSPKDRDVTAENKKKKKTLQQKKAKATNNHSHFRTVRDCEYCVPKAWSFPAHFLLIVSVIIPGREGVCRVGCTEALFLCFSSFRMYYPLTLIRLFIHSFIHSFILNLIPSSHSLLFLLFFLCLLIFLLSPPSFMLCILSHRTNKQS